MSLLSIYVSVIVGEFGSLFIGSLAIRISFLCELPVPFLFPHFCWAGYFFVFVFFW